MGTARDDVWAAHDKWQRPTDDPKDPAGINALRQEIVMAAELLAKRRRELATIQRETMRQSREAFDREIRAILQGGTP